MSQFQYEYNSWEPLKDGECCVSVCHCTSLAGFQLESYANLPCYPEEISNTVEAIWATQSILGRTGTINAFTGTSDISVNFSFDLHGEMPIPEGGNYRNVNAVVAYIKSGCYPSYGSGTLNPPYVIWKFGDTILSGRMKSVSDVWKKPIINRLYSMCSLSISMESATIGIAGSSSVLSQISSQSPGMPNAGSTFTPPSWTVKKDEEEETT